MAATTTCPCFGAHAPSRPGKCEKKAGNRPIVASSGEGRRKTWGSKKKEVEEEGETEVPAHIDAISSPSNPFIKHLVKLRQSSAYRHRNNKVVVVGAIPLLEIFQSTCKPVELLLTLQDADIPDSLAFAAQRRLSISSQVMKKLAGVESPQAVGAVGVLSLPPAFLPHPASVAQLQHWCPTPSRILALEGVQDPGNLGSLLRSAAAFAWDGVLLLPGCCDPFNDKAVRASRGAGFRVPMAACLWPQVLSFAEAANLDLLAAHPQLNQEQDGCKDDEKPGVCLVLGSEGQGLSEQVLQECKRISIPMPGQFESLNVAVAGGILMLVLNRPELNTFIAKFPLSDRKA